MRDDLGTRMKEQYENRTKLFLPRRSYTIIRIDGKAFHTFTRNFDQPFDTDLITAMNRTTECLVSNIQGCKLGFVQSDEISLLLTDFDKITTDAWFNGNVQKIASISASMATAYFNKFILLAPFDKLKNTNLPFFDSRVFTIPDRTEVKNYFIWRQQDMTRNSVQMLARSLYSHKECENKNNSELQEMCFQKGKNWNDLHTHYKRGRVIGSIYSSVLEETPSFTQDLDFLEKLVPKYE